MVRRGTLGTSLVGSRLDQPAFLPADTFELPASPLIERFGLEWLGTGAGRVLTTILLAVGMALLVDAWLRMRPSHGRKAAVLRLAAVEPADHARAAALQPRRLQLRRTGPDRPARAWTRMPSARSGCPGPFADQVDPMWVDTPAPYGPARPPGAAPRRQRLPRERLRRRPSPCACPPLLAVGLLAYALPRLAERYGVSGRHALWLGVLNPLVMMHFIGGAHGDAVMVALVTFALLLGSRGQFVAGRRDDRGRRRLQADRRPRPHRRRRHGPAGPDRPRARSPVRGSRR